MKTSKLVASLMLSTTLLTVATPVLADQVKQNAETSSTKVKSNDKTTNGVDSANLESSSTLNSSTTESKNGSIQTQKEQKMIIKKIIAKGGSQMATVTESDKEDEQASPGISQADYKGVPNSKFVIYDVTDLMETIVKEKLGVNDQKAQQALDKASSEEEKDNEKVETSGVQKVESGSGSSDLKDSSSAETSANPQATGSTDSKNTNEVANASEENNVNQDLVEKVKDLRQGDTLRKAISERAAKLNKDQLKVFSEVTTDNEGKAEVTLPIDGKYHAYYVVNTETDKEGYATNASPIVVITPVTDTDGKYAADFTIYPKSNTVEKETPTNETPQTETTATMYQTGHKSESVFEKIKNWIANLF